MLWFGSLLTGALCSGAAAAVRALLAQGRPVGFGDGRSATVAAGGADAAALGALVGGTA